MAEHQEPFTDVQPTAEGFSLPELKWRELLFVGALKAMGTTYLRDPLRPLPPFRVPDLFPEGMAFEVVARRGGRVFLRPTGGGEGGCV
jgi:hypothetical protein